MLTENEKFNQIIKQLPREIKNIPGYLVILEKISTIKKTINCIDLLSSEAMQKRHWD